MDDMPHMDEMPHMDDMDAMMMDDDMDKEMMKEMDEKPMPPMKHPMPHHHRASYVMPHHTTYHTPAPAYHHPQPYTPHVRQLNFSVNIDSTWSQNSCML